MTTSAPSRAYRTAMARPIPESPPVMRATLSRSFSNSLVFGRLEHGRLIEIAFIARFLKMLIRKFGRILALAGLHRLFGWCLHRPALVLGVDLALDAAFAFGGRFCVPPKCV